MFLSVQSNTNVYCQPVTLIDILSKSKSDNYYVVTSHNIGNNRFRIVRFPCNKTEQTSLEGTNYHFKWDPEVLFPLTYWYGPNGNYFQKCLRSGVESAVMDGVLDGDIAVQWDGTEVHDGGRGEENVQVNPDSAELAGQRPPVTWMQKVSISQQPCTSCGVWNLPFSNSFLPGERHMWWQGATQDIF